MEKKMATELETGDRKGPYRDPGIQLMSTLGLQVCKCYLHRATWIPIHPYTRFSFHFIFHLLFQLITYLGLFGSLRPNLEIRVSTVYSVIPIYPQYIYIYSTPPLKNTFYREMLPSPF